MDLGLPRRQTAGNFELLDGLPQTSHGEQESAAGEAQVDVGGMQLQTLEVVVQQVVLPPKATELVEPCVPLRRLPQSEERPAQAVGGTGVSRNLGDDPAQVSDGLPHAPLGQGRLRQEEPGFDVVRIEGAGAAQSPLRQGVVAPLVGDTTELDPASHLLGRQGDGGEEILFGRFEMTADELAHGAIHEAVGAGVEGDGAIQPG